LLTLRSSHFDPIETSVAFQRTQYEGLQPAYSGADQIRLVINFKTAKKSARPRRVVASPAAHRRGDQTKCEMLFAAGSSQPMISLLKW
jgi:hypothetical protein